MKLKKALSLTLALVLSLAMAVPAFAAKDPNADYAYTASNECVGTTQGSYGETIYLYPMGTVFTPKDPFEWFEYFASNTYTLQSAEPVRLQFLWSDAVYILDVCVQGVDTAQPEQPTTPTEPQPEVKTANPSNDKLTVNGVVATPTVYNIDNNNYFKIRDVAALLNGTEKQFSVGYDGEKQSVTATTGQGYEKLPTDLAGAPAGPGEAKASGDAIYVDGTKITPTVYNINGNNYFKLRDLGEALGFKVDWSAEQGVFIETR